MLDLSDPQAVKAMSDAYAQIPALVLKDLEALIRPDELSIRFGLEDVATLTAFREGMRNVWLHIQKRKRLEVLIPDHLRRPE